jgi:chromosome partitioning protein
VTRKIAFVNEKGGSCKTTLSVNMAAYFAGNLGKKVLLIDMDPQGQAGKALGVDVKNAPVTINDLLIDPSVKAADALIETRIENLDLLCSNKKLTDFPVIAAADEDRVHKLEKAIGSIKGYDFVVFDSPPSLGLLTLNIMMAASEIIIPVSLTYFALDGCAEIIETVENVKTNYGKKNLKVTWIVPTLYRHTRLGSAIIDKLREFFGEKVTETVIGMNVAIDEAQSFGQTIWEYSPKSPGAQMLEALAKEIS